MTDERRVRRSEIVEEALNYQLEASTERAGLKDMLLADQDGLLVATTQSSHEQSEEIAAILPLLARGQDFTGNLMDQGGTSMLKVAVSVLETDFTDLFLCALGGNDKNAFSELEHVKAGVARILN